ncbi:hypothetical protein [Mesorhizobium sp. M1E.F.Ca.ET.063.01.1.1]|uniref:hypothetical protein n=1 Tax=Mesorhizobium sp. M1E.F.Ca.ET.063.01.1.1 TaxID=2496750 RepID=UPI000FD27744|nr:hypothetical protein [Mesorhizobium sp. M1E.F.Ca.ET.063.01.1.1]RUW84120.1 hypothetical protein EOA29_10575 [Mesorhizobium sp. M1E.F.Ca.ET.063.01.1.1]
MRRSLCAICRHPVRIPPLFFVAAVSWPILFASAWAQDLEQEFNRQQFSEWAGIIFMCVPDDDSDAMQKQLCASASAEARLLAASAKIPFQDLSGEPWGRVSFKVKQTRSIILETTIRAARGTPSAIYMRLEATSFYSNAVEQGGREGTLDVKPRAGDLVLWDKDVIGAGGSETELVQGMSNAFATNIKEFFGLFIESRN